MLKKEIDFVSKNKLYVNISIIMMIISLCLFGMKGLNLGTDFAGGILIELEIENSTKDDINVIRQIFNEKYDGKAIVQTSNNNQYIIKFSPKLDENGSYNINGIMNDSASLIKHSFAKGKILRCESVGPQVTKKLILDSIYSLIIAILAMGIYLWIRFNFIFGVATIFALIHDLILVLGFYVVTRIEFDISSIAVLLTVIGYSINDSVIIYDRIRENFFKERKNIQEKDSADVEILYKIINSSINTTLSRTILTVCAILITNLVLIIFGGSVLQRFSIVMFFGILVGTYSSIYISAPILIILSKFLTNERRLKSLYFMK